MEDGLNETGRLLQTQLQHSSSNTARSKEQLINVANVGRVVTKAYEQLRNAAEYSQEHLLRQRAIRRYLARNLSFQVPQHFDRSDAEDLVVELTQAGYVENDSLPYSIIDKLHSSISRHYKNSWRMRASVGKKMAEEWALDLMSVEVEDLIANDRKSQAYQQFAFQHYKKTINKDVIGKDASSQDYDVAFYVAVHRALLKSDLANVRYDLQRMYAFPDTDIDAYVGFHRTITKIYTDEFTERLTRTISRRAAPLRVLKSLIGSTDKLHEQLADRKKFLSLYESQVSQEYADAKRRLDEGLMKSIIFLLITKTLTGLLIEIPYDIAVTGAIVILPLVINLVAPVLYLLVVRLGLKMPGKANTTAMVTYMDNAIYGTGGHTMLYGRARKAQGSTSVGFNIAYAATFIIAFGFVIHQLIIWHFNLVQGLLFFVFLATASLLGFRLTHIIRELELVTVKPGILQIARDFLYLPFIILGRWLSDKYQRINFVALILDTVIELPLKTVLRLLRQWSSFIADKKDAI